MLNIDFQLSGFDEFITKLNRLKGNEFISSGFKSFVNHARNVVIEGNPVGKEEEDDHPGLMKKSWESPVYTTTPTGIQATVTNSVEYGMAENYGHHQVVGMYVPKINARLVHDWVPGTYALENSLDKAEIDIEPIIRPEILKVWNDVRTQYYDREGAELVNDSTTTESTE